MKNFTILALVLCVFTAFSASLNEQPEQVRRINVKDIIADSANVTAEVFPDADDVLLDSVTFEMYNPDGTSVTYDDTYTKVLTEKGKRGAMTSSLHFNVVYGTNEVIAAQVIKPDGKVADVDLTRNSSIMIDPSSMGSNIYDPNNKILKVAYPGVEIGDIVRLAFKRTEYKTRVPDMWSDYQVFESFSPIRRYSYFISSPATRPILHSVLRAPVDGTVTNYTVYQKQDKKGGKPLSRTLHVWDIANVPQAFPEPDMPAHYTVAQRLLLSTAKDWQSLSRWYWNLCKPRLESTTPEMIALVNQIKAVHENEQANSPTNLAETNSQTRKLANSQTANESLIRSLFTWVSQNIRYMGITTESEAPGYEPHDVSMTFSNRHGVCRDKAALLVAMLRLAGIDAYPVLIHVGEKRDAEVPMTFFNHAIVGVRNADGSYMLMDPTVESAHELLPAYLDDKSYLVAHPDGETLLVSPITPATANMLTVKSAGSVDDKGSLLLETVVNFGGINDNVYRGYFARLPAEKRRDFFDGLVKRRIAGATLESLSIIPEDMQDTDTPLSVTFTASAKDFLAKGDNAVLLDLPWFSSSIGYANFLIGATGLEKRKYPLVTETACGVEEEIVIGLTGVGSSIALPEETSFCTNGVTFSQKVAESNGTEGRGVKASRRFELNVTEYPPEQYLGLKKALRDIEYAKDGRAVFMPADAAAANADTRLISKDVVCELESTTNWTYTVSTVREILTYAGKKKNSEISISFNPAWQKVDLLYATVSNANGVVKSVQPQEINIMDKGWVASAPRYPAGKTMVISLPGVETGSVIRTSYRIIRENAPMFDFAAVFQGNDPIDDYRVSIKYPKELPMTFKSFGEVEGTLSHDGEYDTLNWSVHSPKILPREEFLPPAFTYAATAYASAGNWKSYAESVAKALRKAMALEVSAKARAKAHEICDEIKNTSDRVRAIRDFVVRDIRLAGPSFTDIPLMVSDVDTTLSDGYGNAIDRAALLSVMLDAIGLDTDIVLADPERSFASQDLDFNPRYMFPSADVFTRPLVAVQPEKGVTVFLNDTDQYTELGVTPSNQHLAMVLSPLKISDVIDDLNPLVLEDNPVESGKFFSILAPEDKFVSKGMSAQIIELDAEGNASISITNIMYGTDAAAMRKKYTEMTPEQLIRHHQELIGAISVAAKSAGPLQVSVTNYPSEMSYSATAPKYAVRTGNTLTLTLGAPAPVMSFRSDKRTLPIGTSAMDDVNQTTTIVLPAETKNILLMPEDINWSYMGIGGIRRNARSFRRKDGRLCIEISASRLNRFRSMLGCEFYPALLDMNRRLASPSQRTIVISL